MEKEKISPLPEEYWSLPGESSRRKQHKIIYEQFYFYFILWLFLVGTALLEWVYYLTKAPRSPWALTTFAVLVSILFCWRFSKIKKDFLNYNLGSEGEIFVGRSLEGLRAKGFVPIHDVPCENDKGRRFNVDHVLIGPKGVFAVETKTWRKNKGVNEHLSYKNGNLYKGQNFCGTKQITEAKWNAEWMENIFFKRTGEHIPVKPILLFPGRFIEEIATKLVKKDHEVLMLNPKVLGVFLDNDKDILNQEQVTRLVSVISAYVYEYVEQQKND